MEWVTSNFWETLYLFACVLSLSGSCLNEVSLHHHSSVDLFTMAVLFRANSERKLYVKLFRTHGTSHHERSHSACHLHRWKRTERSGGLQGFRFRWQPRGFVCKGTVREKLSNAAGTHLGGDSWTLHLPGLHERGCLSTVFIRQNHFTSQPL